MRGRKQTPTALKVLRGNPGKRKILPDAIKPQKGEPSCPAFLDKEAKDEWGRVALQLSACNVLTHLDRALLTAYCEAWSEFKKMVGYAKKRPLDRDVIITKKEASLRLIRLASEFGFSPAARARIKTEAAEKAADEFEDFVKRA